MIEELTIRIMPASEGGYTYDIWLMDAVDENAIDSADGGLCTSTPSNALEMAYDQALSLLRPVR